MSSTCSSIVFFCLIITRKGQTRSERLINLCFGLRDEPNKNPHMHWENMYVLWPGWESYRTFWAQMGWIYQLFWIDYSIATSKHPHRLFSSSSGSRYRPTWRPRREALNIDSIFTRQTDLPLGYNTPPGQFLPPEPQEPLPFVEPVTQPGLEKVEGRETGEVGFGLIGQPRCSSGGRTMGPPAPPPLRGVEHQPRLIQRMESGYESSERNSSSPDR